MSSDSFEPSDSGSRSADEAEIFTPPDAGDLELRSGDGPVEPYATDESGWDGGGGDGSPWLVPGVVGVVLVLLLGGWWWWQSSKGGPPALPPPPEAPPVSAPPAEASIPMPELVEDPNPPPALDESDAWFREALAGVVEHPKLAAWLAPEDLVRRFVAAIDDLARGESPRKHLVALDPGRGFRVDEFPDGTAAISKRSYHRYDAVIDAFVAVDTPKAMEIFWRMEPLLDEAYRDLGYPNASFRAALETAIDRVLALDVRDEALAVKPRITSWAFADPALEALSPAEKHLLRIGPRNAQKVQGKLRAFDAALKLSP